MGEALTLAVSAVLLAGFYAAMAYGLVLIYRVLVRFLPRGPAGAVQSLLLLFGVWLIIRNLAYLLFTGNDQAIRTRYSLNRVAVFGISLVALLALHLFLTRTYWGKAIRAVAQNPESCTLVGIDVERVYVLSFGLGTALAGLAGVLASTLFAFNPSFGASELLRSFVIIVLGGLGSVVGIALGAGVLAFAEVFSIYVVPSYLTSAVGFVLLVVVLVLRPGGLLGQRVLR